MLLKRGRWNKLHKAGGETEVSSRVVSESDEGELRKGRQKKWRFSVIVDVVQRVSSGEIVSSTNWLWKKGIYKYNQNCGDKCSGNYVKTGKRGQRREWTCKVYTKNACNGKSWRRFCKGALLKESVWGSSWNNSFSIRINFVLMWLQTVFFIQFSL